MKDDDLAAEIEAIWNRPGKKRTTKKPKGILTCCECGIVLKEDGSWPWLCTRSPEPCNHQEILQRLSEHKP